MNYTKSDLQLSDKSLMGAIIQIGKELQKSNTPRSRALNTRLLENFNKYDTNQMTTMLNNFQRLLVESVEGVLGVLDVEYVVEHKISDLKRVIMSESQGKIM